MPLQRWVSNWFGRAGVTINGAQPWDIRVNHPRFYRRALRGPLGLGESYVDGDWDADALDELFRRFIVSDLSGNWIARLNRMLLVMRARLSNLQDTERSRAVAEEHYDLDHRMYEKFLGPYNQYTCCFFDGAEELEQAEIKKLEMICSKLEITSSDRVLDIGCGWGGFAKYAAGSLGCEVTGITISTEQAAFARELTAGLPVNIVVGDYRDLSSLVRGPFDKVLICGMMEHVGYKNYRNLMNVVFQVLQDEGLFLLQTIGNTVETKIVDPWIEKYIFRNSMIPSMNQIVDSIQDLFVVHDWENYGLYYSDTLRAWHENFEHNWDSIAALEARQPFDESFRRMWNYYLLSCKAAFDVESLLLWQVVMAKAGTRGRVYDRVNR